jgi:hypothetical protein
MSLIHPADLAKAVLSEPAPSSDLLAGKAAPQRGGSVPFPADHKPFWLAFLAIMRPPQERN